MCSGRRQVSRTVAATCFACTRSATSTRRSSTTGCACRSSGSGRTSAAMRTRRRRCVCTSSCGSQCAAASGTRRAVSRSNCWRTTPRRRSVTRAAPPGTTGHTGQSASWRPTASSPTPPTRRPSTPSDAPSRYSSLVAN